ncbi:hypothetical protein HHK36_016035 [Tetracentron sinense]|uniref:RING-type E3 ubiquitin transferase n=1 Tax=Tetracentron sinense TaxID=13715 RepID=A0A835DAN0_TETSI|nr:hypothetical protein HHK36_016035 [Tetracentron sinense]
MAISPQVFTPRKRYPSVGSLISSKLSDLKLVQSLLLLAEEISVLKPFQFILKRNSSSIIRKSKLLAILFEEFVSNPNFFFPLTAVLCLEDIYTVLKRIKTLLEHCSNGSKMWLLMKSESVADSFHQLTVQLSTLLDILPLKELDLSEDVKDLVVLMKNQCCNTEAFVDPTDENLRHDLLKLLDWIRREIVPDHSKLAEILEKLSLRDSASCRDEIVRLEHEVHIQIYENWKSEAIALIGLVRYAKCVLFGASNPRSDDRDHFQAMNIPADFRCPITLELMRDPVVVATGQTYDRTSINLWIDSGHNTCPKSGQTLAHTNLFPNLALKNLIAQWCREEKVPYETTENQTSFKATKMMVLFLINKLSVSQSIETANRVVHDLRVLAKTDSDSRACIAEAGAIPLLLRYLGSENPSLQINAVTTILNLSIREANKTRIFETKGVLDGVIGVLGSGATWEAKGNAAATIFSLCAVQSYRKKLGRKIRVITGLAELVKAGPTNSKRDALAAISNLAVEKETVGKLVEGGVVEMALEVTEELAEEAVTILAVVAKRGGAVAVAAGNQVVPKLALVLRDGTDTARERAAAALVSICRRGGTEVVAELAATPGIERVIWELMGMGTVRARRKAATILGILGRQAAGIDGDPTAEYWTNIASSGTNLQI